MAKQRRQAATTLRSKKYGPSNQLAYQTSERMERDKLKASLKRKPRRIEAPKPNDAMNSGTMGGRLGSVGLGSGSRRRRT